MAAAALNVGALGAGGVVWHLQERSAPPGLRVSASAYRKCRALLDHAEQRGLIFGFYRDGRVIRVDEGLWMQLSKAERRSVLVAENCIAFGTAWPRGPDESISAISDVNGRVLDQISAHAQ